MNPDDYYEFREGDEDCEFAPFLRWDEYAIPPEHPNCRSRLIPLAGVELWRINLGFSAVIRDVPPVPVRIVPWDEVLLGQIRALPERPHPRGAE